MGKRCGCVGTDCTCGIAAGPGIVVHGTGSQGNPHILEVAAGATKLVGVGSSYLGITVTGQGTAQLPYIISGVKSGLTPPSVPLRLDYYPTPGTYSYEKPVGCTLIEAILVGAGQGGGAAYDVTGSGQFGGLGGAGGGYLDTLLPVDSAAATGTVVVGSGGAGSPISASGVYASHVDALAGIVGGPTSLTLPGATVGAGSATVPFIAGGGDRVSGAYGSRAGDRETVPQNPNYHYGPGGGAGGHGFTSGLYASTQHPGWGVQGAKHPGVTDPLLMKVGGSGGDGYNDATNNLLANPTFDTSIAHWEPRANCTVALAAGGMGGTNCLQATATGAGDMSVQVSDLGTAAMPCTPGQTLTMNGYLLATTSKSIQFGVGFWDAAGNAIVGLAGVVGTSSPGVWVGGALAITVPANAVFFRVHIYLLAAAGGEVILIDNVSVTQSAPTYGSRDGQAPGGGGGGGADGALAVPGGRGADGAAWIVSY